MIEKIVARISKGLYKPLLIQLLKFGLVGTSGTVFGYLVYLATIYGLAWLKVFVSIDYIIGNIVSWLLGVAWNFYWNKRCVFATDAKQQPWPNMMLKAYASYAFTGLILSNILAVFWVEYINIDKRLIPIINLLFTVPINYVLNKYWTFNSHDRKKWDEIGCDENNGKN